MIERKIADLLADAREYRAWGEWSDEARCLRKAAKLMHMVVGDWIE